MCVCVCVCVCVGPAQFFVWQPTEVPAFKGARAIAGGEHHTIVLMRDGTVKGCGAGTYGMLGRWVTHTLYACFVLS